MVTIACEAYGFSPIVSETPDGKITIVPPNHPELELTFDGLPEDFADADAAIRLLLVVPIVQKHTQISA